MDVTYLFYFKILNKRKIILTLSLLALVLLFNAETKYIVQVINDHINILHAFNTNNPFIGKVYFFIAYILFTMLSIPVALILGLLSGMIFNTLAAIILVSFASSIGATLALILSRYLFRDYFKNKFKAQYIKINKGFNDNAVYYLFALRMCPIFPFFMINIVSGLTTIKLKLFYIVSQLGMLPASVLVILIGKNLSSAINTNAGFDFYTIILLTLLGLLPLLAKRYFNKYL